MGIFQNIKSVSGFLLDQVIPPTCLSCTETVGNSAALCPNCWSSLTFISEPFCQTCGLPFDLEDDDNQVCGPCLKKTPPYSLMRSSLIYDEASRPMILSFKHGDQLDACPTFAKWLATADPSMFHDVDVVTAVPLHWLRLLKRRYNQSAMMSNALAKTQNLRAIPDLLTRQRNTASQGHLTRNQRRANVRGAFRMNPRYQAFVEDKVVLLVDDVLTTGATIEACCLALRNAGAAEVRVLTLARASSS
jgi:ComF family protein